MAKLKIYRLQRRRIFSALLLVIFLLCACGKIPPESGSAICGQCDNGLRTCNECGGDGFVEL